MLGAGNTVLAVTVVAVVVVIVVIVVVVVASEGVAVPAAAVPVANIAVLVIAVVVVVVWLCSVCCTCLLCCRVCGHHTCDGGEGSGPSHSTFWGQGVKAPAKLGCQRSSKSTKPTQQHPSTGSPLLLSG